MVKQDHTHIDNVIQLHKHKKPEPEQLIFDVPVYEETDNIVLDLDDTEE